MEKEKPIKSIKLNTSVEYSRRINMALEYINSNLNKSLSLNDIAAVSHFSSYHFHRIFHALVGETVNGYVSRKRMEKAAKCLVSQPSLSITDIASTSGYSSSANFSKSFKLYFGCSPTDLRQGHSTKAKNKKSKKGKLYSKYGKAFTPDELYSQFVTNEKLYITDNLEDMLMNVKIENLKENTIAYLTSPRGYELESVYETWDKLIQWAEGQQVNTSLERRFAICHDNPAITPENKCRYDAAIITNSNIDISSPYNKSLMPSGMYAVAYYNDVAENITPFMTKICSDWFAKSEYEPDDYPPLFNYLNDCKEDNNVEMNVYIKIKPLVIS